MKVYNLVFEYPEEYLFYNKWFIDRNELIKYIEDTNKSLSGTLIWPSNDSQDTDDTLIKRSSLLYTDINGLTIYDMKKCYINEIDIWITTSTIRQITHKPWINNTTLISCQRIPPIPIGYQQLYDLQIIGYYDKFTEVHNFNSVTFFLEVTTNTTYLKELLSDKKIFDSLIIKKLEQYRLGDLIPDIYDEHEQKTASFEWIRPLISL